MQRLEAVEATIKHRSGEVTALRTDVTSRSDVEALVDKAMETYGKVDVMINNAGSGKISPLDQLRVEEWEEMIDVNIKGVLYGIAAALPVFRTQGFGQFINTASTAAHKTVAGQSVYSATKYAVRAISEGLRQEVGETIRVTVISPGFVKTPFVEHISNEDVRNQLTTARDRMAISPQAIAEAMAFAISQPSNVDINELIIRPTAQS